MEIALIWKSFYSFLTEDFLFLIPVFFAIFSLGVMSWRFSSFFKNTFPLQKMSQAIKLLAGVIFFVWSLGYLLFFVALKYDGANAEELLFRSATCSVQLFLGGVDSNIIDKLHETSHMVLAGYLAFLAFVAICCTVCLVSLLILSRFRAFVSLWWFAIRSCYFDYHSLYIFFGINEESILLAKDIIKTEENAGNNKYRIIFVEKMLVNPNGDEINSWDSILNMFIHRRKTFITVRDLNAYLTIMNGEFSADVNSTQDVFGSLGIGLLSKIINNINENDNSELHIFCLNDNERRDENLFAALELQYDITLLEIAQRVKTTIHTLGRANSANRSIEDFNTISGIDVRIVDPSNLSVELLKRDVRHQPVSFVDIDTERNLGTIKSSFTSLIIGFGETGKDALRFLYEYGAFVDSRSCDDDSFRSPFYCHVVDNQIDLRKSSFVNAAPSMFSGDNRELIQFHNYDYNSPVFFQALLPRIMPKLNYVVIAVGDDEANITLAVRILKYAMREGRDFKRLRIYVRSYEPRLLPYLEKIVKHYNEKEHRIIVFGEKSEIFKFDNIVHDIFEEKGKKYYETYRSLRVDPDNDEGSWDDRRGVLTGSKEKDTYKVIPLDLRTKPSISNLQKLRRKELQDKSNALHEGTKMLILTEVVDLMTIGRKIFPHFGGENSAASTRCVSNGKNEYYGLSDDEKLLMLNLAKLEHIRWNASHEVLGYSFLSRVIYHERYCDETLMLHNCLCPWKELDYESAHVSYIKNYKSFDYGVVETSIYNKMKNLSVS